MAAWTEMRSPTEESEALLLENWGDLLNSSSKYSNLFNSSGSLLAARIFGVSDLENT